jgi:NADPH:quinone reductase-like Zn-dependent oxidoreductase
MPRVVVFHEPGPADVLSIEERPITKPQPNEVTLAVQAIGINRAEVAFRSGKYLETPDRFPARLGFEAAGIIQEVGSSVSAFKVGQRVATLPLFSMREYGVYGEVINVPADVLTLCPENLGWVEAAATWMSALTAYGGLIYTGKLAVGNTVLITGASSGVGLLAIQIAKFVGASVIAATRSPAKQQRLIEVGADVVIVTTKEDLVARLDEITSGSGVDLSFDAVGGGMVPKLMQAASFCGRIVVYGTLSTEVTVLPLSLALKKCVSIHAYRNMSMTCFPEERTKAEGFIFDRLRDRSIKTIIDRVYPLTSVREAHRYMESNEQFGKIVLVTGTNDAYANVFPKTNES